jgi:RND superfamily putative drug exporter
VTAAALLLCVALGLFGLGVVFAVALDAVLVGALLVPALMKLLGHWNWWAPRPMRAAVRMLRLTT